MEISFLGRFCFLVKDKSLGVFFDPHDLALLKKSGFLSLESGILAYSRGEWGQEFVKRGEETGEELLLVAGPGDYEKKGVEIRGWFSGTGKGKNSVYLLRMGGIRLLNLGKVELPFSEKIIEEVGVVDVLFLPLGGEGTGLGVKEAVKFISLFSPQIVIPMNFEEEGDEETKGLVRMEEFLKEIDAPGLKPVEKLLVRSGELPEERQIVWLKRH